MHKRPRKALFTPEDSGCPIPTEQLDDWRQTTVVRTGKEPEIQDFMKQISKTELHKPLPGDHWVGETRLRRKMNPTQRLTGKTTFARQSSTAQPEKQPTTTSLAMRTPQKIWRPKAQQTQPTSIDTPAPTSKITRPTTQEDKQDYWERQGEHWTRHHLVPRTTMFIPTDGRGRPPIDSLEAYTTTITTNNFNEVKQGRLDHSW